MYVIIAKKLLSSSHPNTQAVKMVISIFQHRLCNPPSHLDTQMIHQLGKCIIDPHKSQLGKDCFKPSQVTVTP